MTTTSRFTYLLTGVAFGVGLVLSCSDDSPTHADAAACDCPASEPPLGARITRPIAVQTIPANSFSIVSVQCPEDATILGGGCLAAVSELPDVTLQQSSPNESETQWFCVVKNNTAAPIMYRAKAICLAPAP